MTPWATSQCKKHRWLAAFIFAHGACASVAVVEIFKSRTVVAIYGQTHCRSEEQKQFRSGLLPCCADTTVRYPQPTIGIEDGAFH